jgi:deoxyribose-phosphate aldolase
MRQLSAEVLSGMIDHTLLRPDATLDEISTLCVEARSAGFASVCVNPFYVPAVSSLLQGSNVKTCSVVGFPLGAHRSADKLAETCSVLDAGAQEVDMVINIGALKDHNDSLVKTEIADLAKACHARDAILKVILETGLLTDEEKKRACKLCVDAGADFVKTSTGMGHGGATVADIQLMSGEVKAAGLGVKASGGVRSYADACAMIDAGATRIGTSSGLSILAGAC